MYTLVCDTGINHFCFVVFKENTIIEFDVLKIKDRHALYTLLKNLTHTYHFNTVIVERAYRRNIKGLMYVTVIDIFFRFMKEYQELNIECIFEHPSEKFKRLNVDIKNTSTRERKKKAIDIGKKIVFTEKKVVFSEQSNNKYQELKKFDDFYDCVLMYYTKFIKTHSE